MSLCVWISGQRKELSAASLTSIRVSRGTPLSIFVQRPHKELCLHKPARLEERTKDVSQSGVGFQSRESEIQAQGMRLVTWLLYVVPE